RDVDDRPSRRRSEASDGGRPGRGGMLLTFGIVSIVLSLVAVICLCVPFGAFGMPILPVIGLGLGVPALMMGRGDLARIKAGEISRASQGSTQGGFICGIIGTILNALMLLCSCVFVILIFAGLGLPAFMNASKVGGGQGPG